ncbi:MAG: DMT family transporter [Rhodospirillales bacterium]|nr:DMT family transporter [Rhodospirillales bacterium]
MKTALWGVFWACLSTSLGGTTVVFTRMIIEETDPLSLTAIRYGGAAIILLGFMIAKTRLPIFARKDMVILTLIGTVMFAAFPFFMATALADTTAARGGLLFATMPLITMSIAALFGVERMTPLKVIAVLTAISGTIVALGENVEDIAPHALRGDVFMFLGMLCASSFNVFSGKYLVRYGNLPVMIYTMLVGVSVLFILAIILENPFSGSLDFDLNGWFIVFLLIVPGGALMMFSWGQALQRITPTQAAITVGLNPVTAILLAAWLLLEPITARVVIGFLLIFAAILLANYHRRRPVPINPQG